LSQETCSAAGQSYRVSLPISRAQRWVRDSSVFAWDRTTIRGLVERYPRLLENALLGDSDYVEWHLTSHIGLACCTARQRVAHTLITLARSVGQETPGGTALHSMSWKSVAARWCSGGRNACCWVPYDITARFKFHHLSFRRSVCKLGFGEFEVAQAQRRTHASHVMLFLRQPVHHHHSILVLNSK
jgi:hypothetical protein